MSDPIAAVGAVNALSASNPAASPAGMSPAMQDARLPQANATDAASFHGMVQASASDSGAADMGHKLVDAGMNLSQRYTERIDAAHELASISPDELGIDQNDYLRAMLSVQVSLNEVTVELQSTAQIVNSVKDSFNGLYRMQG
jgi:hypothetical protein